MPRSAGRGSCFQAAQFSPSPRKSSMRWKAYAAKHPVAGTLTLLLPTVVGTGCHKQLPKAAALPDHVPYPRLALLLVVGTGHACLSKTASQTPQKPSRRMTRWQSSCAKVDVLEPLRVAASVLPWAVLYAQQLECLALKLLGFETCLIILWRQL